jgi:AcrR family transcriptional regulator
MSRWEPDARGRLLHAAVELFTEDGYDATTAAQIAERADLTKTTLFRHFADKREILFQGQDELVTLAAGSVENAPSDSAPFELLRAAVLALCVVHTEDRRETRRRLVSILSASTELQERAVFKRSAITGALHAALAVRLGDARRAAILADAGMRAYYDGYAAWIDANEDRPLADVVSGEIEAFESVLVGMNPAPIASAVSRK